MVSHFPYDNRLNERVKHLSHMTPLIHGSTGIQLPRQHYHYMQLLVSAIPSLLTPTIMGLIWSALISALKKTFFSVHRYYQPTRLSLSFYNLKKSCTLGIHKCSYITTKGIPLIFWVRVASYDWLHDHAVHLKSCQYPWDVQVYIRGSDSTNVCKYYIKLDYTWDLK